MEVSASPLRRDVVPPKDLPALVVDEDEPDCLLRPGDMERLAYRFRRVRGAKLDVFQDFRPPTARSVAQELKAILPGPFGRRNLADGLARPVRVGDTRVQRKRVVLDTCHDVSLRRLESSVRSGLGIARTCVTLTIARDPGCSILTIPSTFRRRRSLAERKIRPGRSLCAAIFPGWSRMTRRHIEWDPRLEKLHVGSRKRARNPTPHLKEQANGEPLAEEESVHQHVVERRKRCGRARAQHRVGGGRQDQSRPHKTDHPILDRRRASSQAPPSPLDGFVTSTSTPASSWIVRWTRSRSLDQTDVESIAAAPAEADREMHARRRRGHEVGATLHQPFGTLPKREHGKGPPLPICEPYRSLAASEAILARGERR